MNYTAITTDSGTDFTVGTKSISAIIDEVIVGSKTGGVLIYKKEQLYARVHKNKIEIEYFVK